MHVCFIQVNLKVYFCTMFTFKVKGYIDSMALKRSDVWFVMYRYSPTLVNIYFGSEQIAMTPVDGVVLPYSKKAISNPSTQVPPSVNMTC